MNAVPTVGPDGRCLHGWFDRDLPPVLTVDPGTTVRFGTLDSGWHLEPDPGIEGAPRRRAPEHTPDAGHALTGPVEVRGARAGQVLVVRIDGRRGDGRDARPARRAARGARPDAMALASVVVDLRVTHVANQVFGVHAVLPADAVRSA